MSDDPPRAPAPSGETIAQAEWRSLLQRMRAAHEGQDRLHRVRHAIASGEFQVDARAIAERLISRLMVS